MCATAHFDDIREHVTVTRHDKRDAIRHMIENRALTTVFQPIWDLDTSTLLGLEGRVPGGRCQQRVLRL